MEWLRNGINVEKINVLILTREVLVEGYFIDQYANYTSVISSHYIDNPASGRVMEKCGFVPTGETAVDTTLFDGKEHLMRVLRLEINPQIPSIPLES